MKDLGPMFLLKIWPTIVPQGQLFLSGYTIAILKHIHTFLDGLLFDMALVTQN